MSLNTTNLKQKRGGRTVKQADRSSTFLFVLQDGQGREINLDGKQADISLHNPNNGRYWDKTTTVRGSEVEFNLPGNLADDDYILEISSGGYVFPSDNDLIITVTKGYAQLLSKETAESTGLTFEEIRKEVEEKAEADLDNQIVKIRGEKDTALEEIDSQAQSRISDLKSHTTDGKNQVNKARDEAISKVNNTRDTLLSDLDSKTQDGLKKIGDKSQETISTIDNKKSETLQGLTDTRKTFESNIDGALVQAIKDIPYEKLKGEKGDTPRIVDTKQNGLERTYTFDTTDQIKVKDGKDGTINVAKMTESQLLDIKRQLEVPAKEDFVDKKSYDADKSSLDTAIKALEDGKADKSELTNLATKEELTSVDVSEQLKNYATTQALEEYKFEQSNLIDRVKRGVEADLEDMEKQYAKKSDIPDLTPYATNDEVEDLYNGLKTDINGKASTKNLQALESELGTKANKSHTHSQYVQANSGTKIWTGTESEYKAIESKDPNTLYFVVE